MIVFLLFFLMLISVNIQADTDTTQGEGVGFINFVPTTVKLNQQKNKIIINLPYNQAVYLLAYNTYLANNNVMAALQVAEHAVKAQPHNMPWRQRLLQAAIWANDNDTAMKQLVYILKVKKDKQTLMQFLQLGNYTSHWSEVIKEGKPYLKEYPNNKTLIMALAYAYNGLGEPHHAIDLLRKAIKRHPEKAYFDYLISIFSILEENTAIQKTALKEKKLFGTSPSLAVTLADTYYANNNLKSAERELLAAVPKAHLSDSDFWITLANTAWLLNDYPTTLTAYKKLYAAKKIQSVDATQLVQLLLIYDAERGVNTGLTIWQKYHNKNALFLVLDYLNSFYSVPLAIHIFSQIPSSAEKELFNTLSFWETKAKLLQNLGENEQAQAFLVKGIVTHPEDSNFQLIYLSFLSNQVYYGAIPDALSLLPITLIEWQYKAFIYDRWLSVYSNAYLMENNPLLAYELDKLQFNQQQTNYDYLNHFASTADAYGYLKIAQAIDQYTLSLYNANILSGGDVNAYRVFLSTGSEYLPINNYYQGLIWLTKQPGGDNKTPLLDWAFANNQLALAKAIINMYYLNNYPAWAQLKLAMQENNVQEIYRLLIQHSSSSPKDDYVTAANQINDISIAGLASVQTLRKPTAELDQNTPQMIQLSTNAANRVSLTQGYDTYGTLAGNKTNLSVKINMGNNVTLEPYANTWFTLSNDPTQLVNVPTLDEHVGLKYTKQTQDNWYEWDLGVRDDLATFMTLSFEDRYEFTPDLNLDTKLGYNQKATQTPNLWVTSVQDEANFNLSYNLSSYDNVIATVNGSEFFSQEGTYVGNGLQMLFTADHKFWLSYPDFTLGVFGEVDKFNANGTVTPFMTQVIPAAQQPATAASFVPESYWQTGGTFNFGENLLTTRTDRFRPYGNVTLFYNSVSGSGNSYEAGLVGNLLGTDQVNIFFSESKNSGGLAQKDIIMGVRYQYFYS